MRLAERVEHLPELLHLVQLVEVVQPFGVDGVERGQRLGALSGEAGACLGQPLVAQDAARDGLALDVAGHQPRRAQPVVVAGGHHLGHGHADDAGRADQAGLGGHAAARTDAARALPLEDHPPRRRG